MKPATTLFALVAFTASPTFAQAVITQPPSPVDPSPINGETYYLINQLSGLQMDLNGASTAIGDNILQNARSFMNLSQRWAMTKLPDGNWKISNIANGLCLDSAPAQTIIWTVQNPCGIAVPTQEWSFTYITNGYNTITNSATNFVLDVQNSNPNAGAKLIQSPLSGSPTQSQQWLFRASYFRGNDMSTASKEEYDRVAVNSPNYIWWHDAYLPGQDILQIFKNHGMNTIRLRPASINTTVLYGGVSFSMSAAPYNHYTLAPPPATQIIPATATGSAGQHAQTDWSAVDLAVRAKNLGMSVELSLFYDGDNTSDTPENWAGMTIAQLAGVPPNPGLMYNYVKQELELFRANGAMPDLVAIGNEVNTGMFTTSGSGGLSPSGTRCTPSGTGGGSCFPLIQQAAMQAILDAASDNSNPALLGPPIPPPLRCIHVDGNPDLQTFFAGATQSPNSIPIEAICQSYYPGWHGPLTQAQQNYHECSGGSSGSSTFQPCTSAQHIEEADLATEASGLGLPVFTIEDGVEYQPGGSPIDVWYSNPPSRAQERQYTIDLNKVQKNMPNNLSLGMEYWAAEATTINGITGSEAFWVNGDLGLFDMSTVAGNALDNAVLPVMLALGGKLDPTLTYKFVNAANGRILETADASTAPGASLRTGLDNGVTGPHQQWQILAQGADPEQNASVFPAPMDHLGDGYFQIVNMNQTNGLNVLDANGSTAAGSLVVQNPQTAAVTAISQTNANQEWDIMTVGNCGDTPADCTSPPLTATGDYYMIVNKATGLVLAAAGTGASAVIQQQAPAAPSNGDWMVPANQGQLWQIFPAHIAAAPSVVSSISTTASGLAYSRVTQTFHGTVTIKNTGVSTVNGPFQIVFSSLTPGVTLTNATDSFQGSPFLTVPGITSLAPGQSATIAVQFGTPSPAQINFKPVTYAGSL